MSTHRDYESLGVLQSISIEETCIKMKYPKYSCSTCGKPSTRKWNLIRHISTCHGGVGNCVSNWNFPAGSYRPHWSRWGKENSRYIRPEQAEVFLSPSNESFDRKPTLDYQRLFTEECVREIAKKAINQAAHITMPFHSSSPINQIRSQVNYDSISSIQIFGFRGYVCDKCLSCETHYVGFPDAPGQGRIDIVHYCEPTKAAAVREMADKTGMYGFLCGKIPTLIKQKVNSWTGNNKHLVSLKLSTPPEEIIKLRNPLNPTKPDIVFRYPEQRYLAIEPANKNKSNYLIRAIEHGTILLNDEELMDFIEKMKNVTFGIVRVDDQKRYKNASAQASDVDKGPLQSYFVFVK